MNDLIWTLVAFGIVVFLAWLMFSALYEDVTGRQTLVGKVMEWIVITWVAFVMVVVIAMMEHAEKANKKQQAKEKIDAT